VEDDESVMETLKKFHHDRKEKEEVENGLTLKCEKIGGELGMLE
jgi:hypothetical protein